MLEKTPMEWIDKIFDCLELFYQDRWRETYKPDFSLEYVKAQWQSALTGLTHDDIKHTLKYFRTLATHFPNDYPPHQLDFYKVADTIRPKRIGQTEVSKEIAMENIKKIKKLLRPILGST